jgi:hypothetical protein
MDDFLHQMAAKWPGNDEIVKAKIAALIDGVTDAERSAEFYLGFFNGLLIVTERLPAIFGGMDENVRGVYFTMLSYCAYRYVQLSAT